MQWLVFCAVACLAVDILAVCLGYTLAFTLDSGLGFVTSLQLIRPVFLLGTLVIWPLAFAVFGLYRRHRPAHDDEMPRICGAVLSSALLVALITAVGRGNVARDFLATLPVVCFVTVVSGRLLTRLLAHTLDVAGGASSREVPPPPT